VIARRRHNACWLDRLAISAVIARQVLNFRGYWGPALVSSAVEPVIFLLALGIGIGSLVSQSRDYLEFVATGTVVTAMLFSSALPAMYATFVQYRFQHAYDAILATPVDVEDVVTGEALWLAARAGAFVCMPLAVGVAVGIPVSWRLALIPPIACLAGFGWACFGIAVAGVVTSIDHFSYVSTILLTPLYLLGGIYFPLDGLPDWVQRSAVANPVHTCVVLVRHAVFGVGDAYDALRVASLVAFALLARWVAAWRLRRRLVQ
jgi:lipooligosaccharide transport system permease protein